MNAPAFQNIEDFFAQYFSIILAAIVLWNVGCVALALWWRRSFGTKFPPIKSVNVLYRGQFASGHSHKSLFTRLMSASNCLTVIVTDHEVWITSFFPFTTLLGMADLEHRIPRDRITNVDRDWRRIRLDFVTPVGTSRRLTLRLWNAIGFTEALDPDDDER